MTIETRTEDRKALAKALAEELGTEARYMGVPSCAYQVGDYTVNKDGSVGGEDFEPIRDFLIRNGYIEVIPMTETAETPAAIPEKIEGTSVTIPLRDYTAQGLTNLLRTLYARQDLMNAMLRGDTLWVDEELTQRLRDEQPDTPEAIQRLLKEEIDAGMVGGVNLEDGKITMDFPFREDKPTEWTAYADLLIAMADKARNAKHAGGQRITPEDSEMKYFCRSWLVQLGFGGAEHKETRRVLLGHLHGFAAFRTADKMDAHKAKLAAKRKTRRTEIVPEVTVHDPD